MKQKTEEITFTTLKSVDQIADAIRLACTKTKGQMERLQSDALGNFGEDKSADIEVVLRGKVGLIGGMKHYGMNSMRSEWAVQIYVYEQGRERLVQLVALGATSLLFGVQLNLGASKEKLEIIRQCIAY